MSPLLAPSSGRGMSAIPPLLGGKQTSGKRAKMTRVTQNRLRVIQIAVRYTPNFFDMLT
jgi:hypothetical protein